MSTPRTTHTPGRADSRTPISGSTDFRSTGSVSTGPARTAAPIRGIPFLRLTAVELRKQLDTRAGLWLLVAIAVVSAGFIALTLFTAEPETITWTSLTAAASIGQLLLLPLIGVMAATSEWSARTALTTFTLEPRRTRVNGAKLASSATLGLLVMVVTLAVSALLNAAGIVWRDADGSWALDWGVVAGTTLALVLLIWQGVAFGLAFLSTPIAIVAYLALPTVWTILTVTIEALREPAQWLDTSLTFMTLMSGSMTADDWPKLAVSVLVWIGVPMAYGLWRTARREP
ncbi:ABC transporter permease [Marisediminicola senii]|uniref:ABC transporter permease n=1 Tax=Marisediminicola senii TaxID=2711233 RepID=UPI0013ED93B0|nr:ABC transporter permease [Marisediminicola senii]